ncbi:slr1659 superfamily regulator [Beggiatoa leptomitoformis]|uniref:STAS domain-containing protein n=1 Tax=Beggiatoa leptomitoformis TaxID=288004 RepID=A0A2N9YAD1_9GAMM|nr:hypothetical protein [Beggiatoa leptomitoformis]ALG67176.1 hypothetical protein AL038_04935 [Beggiatoa leptomitoformis]AUI67419.1 hypothetical protein BLE401_01060 [Beggiatoa leptomitoformis]
MFRKIRAEDYRVESNVFTGTITFQGKLQLQDSKAYMPILEMLNELAEKDLPKITIDLRALELLNSSGINTLSKFLMQMERKNQTHVIVHGLREVTWQDRMLTNIKRVLPGFQLSLQ